MPKPTYRLWVDWDNDGSWNEANEDVTEDVLSLNWEWGRDMQTLYAKAASLDFALKNGDHKYTPPNSGGALYGDLVPGRNVRFHMGYPVDDCTDTDSTALENHTVTNDSNYAWTAKGSALKMYIVGNRIRDYGVGLYTIDFGESDLCIGSWYERNDAVGSFVLRYQDNNNFIYLRIEAAQLDLRKNVAAVHSSIATGALAWTGGDTKWVEIEMHGDSIRVFVDFVEIIDTTESSFSTETEYGIQHTSGVANQNYWDDFGAWRHVFYGKIDKIDPRPEARQGDYCYISCFDKLERCRKSTLYAMQGLTDRSADELIGDILTYIGDPTAERQLDSGDILAADFHSMWRTNALDELYSIQDEEDGFIYVDGHGFMRLENQTHRDSAPHTTSRVLLQGDQANSPYFSGFRWDDGKELVENHVTFRYRRFPTSASVELWKMPDEMTISGATLQSSGDTFATTDSTDNIYGANWASQVFTTTSAYTIRGVNLHLKRSGSPGTITVSIKAEDGAGKPTGADLCSGTYDGDTLNDSAGAWVQVNMGPGTALSNATKYCIVIRAATGDASNYVQWSYYAAADGYAGGDRVTSPDSGSTWNIQAAQDFNFAALITDTAATRDVLLETTYDYATFGTPIITTDYTGFTATGGGGVNVSTQLSMAFVETSTYSGKGAKLRISNNGGETVYINLLKSRGTGYTVGYDTLYITDDSTSISEYGERQREIDCHFLDTYDMARTKGNARLARLKDERAHVAVSLGPGTKENIFNMVQRVLSDRITITYSDFGLSTTAFMLEAMRITVPPGGYPEATWELRAV